MANSRTAGSLPINDLVIVSFMAVLVLLAS
jgi:hypothetical protein